MHLCNGFDVFRVLWRLHDDSKGSNYRACAIDDNAKPPRSRSCRALSVAQSTWQWDLSSCLVIISSFPTQVSHSVEAGLLAFLFCIFFGFWDMASQAGPNQWPPYPQVPHFRNDSDTLFDRMSRSSQGSGTSQSTLGLGIMNDSSREESSSASASSTPEHGKPCSGLAQRIERSLWQWSSSESFAARWLFEIISWTISAISMGAFIGILVVLKDKEVPDWPLNLVLSLLSRTAAGALILPVSEALGQLKWSWFQKNSQKMWDFEVFDDASRGPWGSALLLIRTRGRCVLPITSRLVIVSN